MTRTSLPKYPGIEQIANDPRWQCNSARKYPSITHGRLRRQTWKDTVIDLFLLVMFFGTLVGGIFSPIIINQLGG